MTRNGERESRDSQGEIQGYTGMYPTTVMHTDNCTQRMNTHLKKGARRDSSRCPTVMESQRYNRLHVETHVWESDWICHQLRSRKGGYVRALATGLWSSFCFQLAILVYRILIKRNVFSLPPLLSEPTTQYFLTQSFLLPISFLWPPTISCFFLFFSAPVDCGISGIAGRPMGS